MEYLVREIHITDYQDIYLLNREFNPNLSSFTEEKVKEKIGIITRETTDKIFVFELNNEIVGYIHGSRHELLFADPLINVLGFVVKERYRNQGIGSKLMDYLEHWAREEGYSGIKCCPIRVASKHIDSTTKEATNLRRIKKILLSLLISAKWKTKQQDNKEPCVFAWLFIVILDSKLNNKLSLYAFEKGPHRLDFVVRNIHRSITT
ncbi:GNAT family N-acetyltransferase [Paenibacillus sanfengchensis]|uniref:GNAT family N-acetyltransferase n=1 Tax=Paenibacillus sanfengchensis TaxID=3119819 RepID=UPI002FE15767